jgi:hypothetical protein
VAEPDNEERSMPAISPSTRAEIVGNALRQLPAGATAQDKQRAIQGARTAMQELGVEASPSQLIEAANLAVACVADDVRCRLRREHWRERAPGLLPWGAEDEDKREAANLAVDALKGLPPDLPDWKVEQEIRRVLKPLFHQIEAAGRVKDLIEYGRRHVGIFLSKLYHEGVITGDEWLDPGLRRHLERTVAEELREGCDYGLDGPETEEQVADMVESMMVDELDLEVVTDDSDEEDQSDEED